MPAPPAAAVPTPAATRRAAAARFAGGLNKNRPKHPTANPPDAAGAAPDALLTFYRRAAQSGNPSAQLSLALRLLQGDGGGAVDYAEVLDLRP
jgi:TPR repeat protein